MILKNEVLREHSIPAMTGFIWQKIFSYLFSIYNILFMSRLLIGEFNDISVIL